MTRTAMWATAVWLAAIGTLHADEPTPTIEKAMRREAPGLLEELHKRGYKHVGVLTFLAARGDEKPRATVGALNRSLADRLEVALVLAQPEKDTLDVILNASDAIAATKNKMYAHDTAAGRALFFAEGRRPPFKPSWGAGDSDAGGVVTADAFLTGEARLSPDLKTVNVTVQLFDRDHTDKLCSLRTFTAAVDWRTLAESGVSFARKRGSGIKDPDEEPQPAVVVAKDNDDPPYYRPDDPRDERLKQWKATTQESPVKLRVYYTKDPNRLNENELVSVTDGAVPEPEMGRKVAIVLENTDKPDDPAASTYGVVLMVNGENTIGRETLTSAKDSRKWVLKPGDKITIGGFQEDAEKAQEFKVVAADEAKPRGISYDVTAIGTISMVVFRGARPGDDRDDALVLQDERRDPEMKSLGRGSLRVAAGTPMTLAALKGALEEDTKARSGRDYPSGRRGVIAAGESVVSETREVAFRALPQPVAAEVLRYYKRSPEP
jgi:hypothetical protein